MKIKQITNDNYYPILPDILLKTLFNLPCNKKFYLNIQIINSIYIMLNSNMKFSLKYPQVNEVDEGSESLGNPKTERDSFLRLGTSLIACLIPLRSSTSWNKFDLENFSICLKQFAKCEQSEKWINRWLTSLLEHQIPDEIPTRFQLYELCIRQMASHVNPDAFVCDRAHCDTDCDQNKEHVTWHRFVGY